MYQRTFALASLCLLIHLSLARPKTWPSARNTATEALVPEVLADVTRYSKALQLAITSANHSSRRTVTQHTPTERIRKLAASSQKQRIQLQSEQIPLTEANITLITADQGAPSATTLARVVYDRRTSASVSIVLYHTVSKLVGRLSCTAMVLPGPPKQVRRIIFKSCANYGGDTSRCKDKARVTVEVGTTKTPLGTPLASQTLALFLQSKSLSLVRNGVLHRIYPRRAPPRLTEDWPCLT